MYISAETNYDDDRFGWAWIRWVLVQTYGDNNPESRQKAGHHKVS